MANTHVPNCPYPTHPAYGCWCPMDLGCARCGRTLDDTSTFGITGQHDCSAEAARESQGTTPENASAATLTALR